jgi:hypothetical protein
MSEIDTLSISGFALRLTCSLVPWDTDAFAFPVAQISHIETGDVSRAKSEYAELRDWLAWHACVVSCRLPHDHFRESMFSSPRGFDLSKWCYTHGHRPATLRRPRAGIVGRSHAADDPALEAIAFSPFRMSAIT